MWAAQVKLTDLHCTVVTIKKINIDPNFYTSGHHYSQKTGLELLLKW